MSEQPGPSSRTTSNQRAPAAPTLARTGEDDIDSLLVQLEEKKRSEKAKKKDERPDLLAILRRRTIEEFIPAFVELTEKYSEKGIVLEMDASNLIQGGREVKFQFGVGPYRTELLGTATEDAIAFHQVRYTPELDGELTGGPMLRLRSLTVDVFRTFVCERLAILLRTALRRR